jgi:hypothetical protein
MRRSLSRLYWLPCSLALLLPCSTVWARYEATLVKEYTGPHQDAFITQFDRVRLLVRQAQVEDSALLGLFQYREGFQYPLFIHFEDGAPAGAENALAYVRLGQTSQGFAQELVVNLAADAGAGMDFDRIFYHEMTHAVMNDAVGSEASLKIPHWVQEGLAQYVSGEGKNRVTQAAGQFKKSQVKALLYNLEGPYTGAAYPQYYLAIECLYEKHSVNAVQALVRDLIQGKSTTDSIEDVTGLSWDKFQEEVRDYSLKSLQDKARSDY